MSVAIIPIISGIVVTSIGIFVLRKNYKKKLNRIFFFLCVSLAIWLFASYWLFVDSTDHQILFWDRIVYIGVVFVPTFIYHLAAEFTKNPKRRVLQISYLLSFMFLITTRSEYFISDIFRYPWGAHTKADILHHIFLVFFGSFILTSYYHIYKFYKTTASTIAKMQAKYILLALIILVFIGSLAYLPAYEISIFPFPYLAGVLFVSIIAYAITRYRFLDVRVIVRKSLVIGTALLLEIVLMGFFSNQLLQNNIFREPVSHEILIIIMLQLALIFFGLYFLTKKLICLFWKGDALDITKLLAYKPKRPDDPYTIECFEGQLKNVLEKYFDLKNIECWVIREQEILYASSFRSQKILPILCKMPKNILFIEEEVSFRQELSKYRDDTNKIFRSTKRNGFIYSVSAIWGLEAVCFLQFGRQLTADELKNLEAIMIKANNTIIEIYTYQEKVEYIRSLREEQENIL